MSYFDETQRLPRFLMLAILSGVLIFGIVLIVLQTGGSIDPKTQQTLWIVWAAMAVIDGSIASFGMVTQIMPDGILVRCTPLGFLKRHIDWNDIDRMYARTYAPLAEYGGWGIRFGKSGKAYNMRGNQGIQLDLKNGKKLLIGTQQPDAFLAAVRSAGFPLTDK